MSKSEIRIPNSEEGRVPNPERFSVRSVPFSISNSGHTPAAFLDEFRRTFRRLRLDVNDSSSTCSRSA